MLNRNSAGPIKGRVIWDSGETCGIFQILDIGLVIFPGKVLLNKFLKHQLAVRGGGQDIAPLVLHTIQRKGSQCSPQQSPFLSPAEAETGKRETGTIFRARVIVPTSV